MNKLTKQQQSDIDLLVYEARYSREQATLSVAGPRRKVRAPTLAEIEKLSARQIKEITKC